MDPIPVKAALKGPQKYLSLDIYKNVPKKCPKKGMKVDASGRRWTKVKKSWTQLNKVGQRWSKIESGRKWMEIDVNDCK